MEARPPHAFGTTQLKTYRIAVKVILPHAWPDLICPPFKLYSRQVSLSSCNPPMNQLNTQVIDAATDSSRYFALRVENPETGAHHFLGIGFAERDTAGQFKLTLAEHGKYIQRMKKAQSEALQPAAAEDSAVHAPSASASTPPAGADSQGRPGQPQRDLSLKGSIRVTLPNQSEKRGLMAKLNEAADKPALQVAVGPKGGLLPPPPISKIQAPAASTNRDGKPESWVSFGADPGQHASEFNPFPDAAAPAVPGVSGGVEGASSNDADFGDFCGAD